MKPGDRVIWLRSPGRSFLTGWRVEQIPGTVVRVCPCRVRICINVSGMEKTISVAPENLMSDQDEPTSVKG
jgi:hypothetical protein